MNGRSGGGHSRPADRKPFYDDSGDTLGGGRPPAGQRPASERGRFGPRMKATSRGREVRMEAGSRSSRCRAAVTVMRARTEVTGHAGERPLAAGRSVAGRFWHKPVPRLWASLPDSNAGSPRARRGNPGKPELREAGRGTPMGTLAGLHRPTRANGLRKHLSQSTLRRAVLIR